MPVSTKLPVGDPEAVAHIAFRSEISYLPPPSGVHSSRLSRMGNQICHVRVLERAKDGRYRVDSGLKAWALSR
jgi:hypothetical protein